MMKILHEGNSRDSFTAYLIRVSYNIPCYAGKYWLADRAWMMRISYFLSLKRKKSIAEAMVTRKGIKVSQCT
jgi:hypothetical protein